MDKDDWLRIIRRSELSFTTKGIAVYLAIFADQDGSQVRPGEERAAGELDLTTRCVREHMEILRNAGLIERVNRGTAVRGRADKYQLTCPGAGHEPVPMRFDPDGNRLTPVRPVRKRAKKAADPAVGEDVTGTPVPESEDLTGTGVPVDNTVTGTTVPVDDATYRNGGSSNQDWLADAYRNPGSDLPEPLSTVTGTGVPPTNQTNHDHPIKPAGSPQASTSPDAPTATKNDHEVVLAETITVTDDEYAAARSTLRELPDFGMGFRDQALASLATLGIHDPPLRLVIVRAAAIATRPDPTT